MFNPWCLRQMPTQARFIIDDEYIGNKIILHGIWEIINLTRIRINWEILYFLQKIVTFFAQSKIPYSAKGNENSV